jgi:hypothetical protein
MRILPLLLAASVVAALAFGARTPPSWAQEATPRPAPKSAASSPGSPPVGTMSELMVHLIRPTSDAVFYIGSRTPGTDAEWATLQAQTLVLAEAGELLLLPGRARGRAQWRADARLMREAGRKAFAAAKAKDVAALEALNDELYQSCVTCHEHFRPGYGRRGAR